MARLGGRLVVRLLQIEIEGCSNIGFSLKTKVSAVGFDDGLGNGQTKTRSVIVS
jgi:hypothetical protein